MSESAKANAVASSWVGVGACVALGVDRLVGAAFDGQLHKLVFGLLWLAAAAYFWRKTPGKDAT